MRGGQYTGAKPVLPAYRLLLGYCTTDNSSRYFSNAVVLT